MKKLTFSTIKKPVSDEEKRQRAKFYMEDTGIKVDVDAFVKQEIYDEYVEMKCLDCDYEETVDFDVLAESMEFDDSDYPSLYCPSCNEGTMVPKDIYAKKKRKQ